MKKTAFKGIRSALKRLTEQFLNDKTRIGYVLVDEMKAAIARGQSPIREVGRFIKYKDQSKYPGNGKFAARHGKKRSPVNLNLTGEMLDSFMVKADLKKITVGIFDKEEQIKMKVLQAGLPPLAGPRRVFPSKSGDEFTVKIVRALIKEFRALLKKAIR